MGAFFLIRRMGTSSEDLRHRLSASFERQGFRPAVSLSGSDWDAVGYHPLGGGAAVPAMVGEDRAFCAGTLFYGGLAKEAALRRLLEDHRTGQVDEAALFGSFAVLLVVAGEAAVLTDRTGTFHVYAAQSASVLSTSVIALAEALPSVTIDEDGLYDYVLQGAPMGPGTIFREIELLDSVLIHVVGSEVSRKPRPPLPAPPPVPGTLDEAATHCLDILRRRFAVAAQFWTDVDTALSGGYDSRLLLALARDAGMTPRVHVYGQDDDPDVVCAKAIAAGENFPIAHVDKQKTPLPPPDRFAETVHANYLSFDGYPTDGIFDNGTDLATRLARMADGALMLNGGGGEIFRNFFYLPDRPISALRLAWTFYCQFDPQICTGRFDERGYLTRLAERLRKAIDGGPDPLSRREVEAAYPWFRCRYWTGHNNSLNNRLGFAWTPFLDPVAVAAALELPLAFKNGGRLEARMIALLAPRLATYASVYGRSFDRTPPLTHRLVDFVNRWRPPLLRRYSYRLKRLKRRRGPAFTGALRPDLLATVIDREFPYLREYFQIEAVDDAAQLQRICTLEYMFERLQPRRG